MTLKKWLRILMFTYYWRVRSRLSERFGQPCAVLIRGKMNNCLVQFEDGFKVITSRNYVRRLINVKSN